jgi:hypothetical protein
MMQKVPDPSSMITRAVIRRAAMVSAAALLGYGGMRLALPTIQAGAKSGTAGMAEPGGESRLGVVEQPEDLLGRRLLLLDRMQAADAAGLRRMLEDDGINRQEKQLVAHRWARHDPSGLLNYLKATDQTRAGRDGGLAGELIVVLFRVWVEQDPEAALAAADALGDRPAIGPARWEMIKTLFGADPSKAFAAAVKLPPWGQETELDEAAWKKNPGAFLKAAGEAPPGAIRNFAMWSAVEQAFGEHLKQDPAAAAAWLKALPPEQQRKFWSRLAGQLAKAEPARAQAWFNGTPPSAEREKAGAEIVKVMAQKDPGAALTWLQDNLEGGRTAGFAYIAEALAGQGVDSARTLLEAMPPGTARDGVVRVIARHWAGRDFKPAIAWVLSLPPDDPGRQQAMIELGTQWPHKDLAGAAAYLKSQNSRQTEEIMMPNVTRQFLDKDPAGGFAWADSLPDQVRSAAYHSFFQAAFESKQLPEVFAAVEKLPSAGQEAVVRKITEGVVNRLSHDANLNERYFNALRLIPAPLRPAARDAVGKNHFSDELEKQSALDALK